MTTSCARNAASFGVAGTTDAANFVTLACTSYSIAAKRPAVTHDPETGFNQERRMGLVRDNPTSADTMTRHHWHWSCVIPPLIRSDCNPRRTAVLMNFPWRADWLPNGNIGTTGAA
jgi:hypothetical protein